MLNTTEATNFVSKRINAPYDHADYIKEKIPSTCGLDEYRRHESAENDNGD